MAASPRVRRATRGALLVFLPVTVLDGCRPTAADGRATESPGAKTPTVHAVLGARALDVEHASGGALHFPDDDGSAAVLTDDPVALVYADSTHGFTLPAGRFLRIDQEAGRVHTISVTPHLDALTPATARVLVDSVGSLLRHAGWHAVPGRGEGIDAALRASTAAAMNPQGGFGVVDVGQWRLPRARTAASALPVGATSRPDQWDGPEAALDVKPVRPADPAANARGVTFVLQLRLTDDPLASALYAQVEARRARLNGEPQTLRSWIRQPAEDIAGVLRRRAAMADADRP